MSAAASKPPFLTPEPLGLGARRVGSTDVCTFGVRGREMKNNPKESLESGIEAHGDMSSDKRESFLRSRDF